MAHLQKRKWLSCFTHYCIRCYTKHSVLSLFLLGTFSLAYCLIQCCCAKRNHSPMNGYALRFKEIYLHRLWHPHFCSHRFVMSHMVDVIEMIDSTPIWWERNLKIANFLSYFKTMDSSVTWLSNKRKSKIIATGGHMHFNK